jgi:hypothetical protein
MLKEKLKPNQRKRTISSSSLSMMRKVQSMETLLQQHTTFSVVKELKGSWEFKPPSTSLQEHKASKFSSKAQR